MRTRKVLTLALTLVAGGLRAADRVSVGDPAVSGAALKPYTNRWKFSQQKPGQPPVEAGIWTDALERTTVEGHPALKRTQVAKYNKGIEITFVSIFDPRTMEPFSFDYSRSSDGNTRHVEFRREDVTYRQVEKTGAELEESAARLDRRVFDFYGGMYGLLISTLPLKTGYAAEIPALDTNTMAVDWVPVQVTGRETVDAGPGKRMETWVVETATRKYGRMTWWVTKSPPYVIQASIEVLKQEDGSHDVAAIVTYRMA
jgi:hypothetical protein